MAAAGRRHQAGRGLRRGAVREALEETGLHVELRRYLVASRAVFRNAGRELPWRTHVFLAETADEDARTERPRRDRGGPLGTLAELGGPLRERLLATGRAFWRYRVALHDAALRAMPEA